MILDLYNLGSAQCCGSGGSAPSGHLDPDPDCGRNINEHYCKIVKYIRSVSRWIWIWVYRIHHTALVST